MRVGVVFGALGLAVVVAVGCTTEPDFDSLRDADRPESWAYGAFRDEALRLVHGQQVSALSFSQCDKVSIYDLLDDYKPSKFARTMIRACNAIEKVRDKYGEGYLGNEYFLEMADDFEEEAFANEVGR